MTKTHKLDVRLTAEQRKALDKLAAENGRSRGDEVRAAIDRHVAAKAEA